MILWNITNMNNGNQLCIRIRITGGKKIMKKFENFQKRKNHLKGTILWWMWWTIKGWSLSNIEEKINKTLKRKQVWQHKIFKSCAFAVTASLSYICQDPCSQVPFHAGSRHGHEIYVVQWVASKYDASRSPKRACSLELAFLMFLEPFPATTRTHLKEPTR